jgi:hypothetical protein
MRPGGKLSEVLNTTEAPLFMLLPWRSRALAPTNSV